MKHTKLLAILFSLVMVFGLVPSAALAASGDAGEATSGEATGTLEGDTSSPGTVDEGSDDVLDEGTDEVVDEGTDEGPSDQTGTEATDTVALTAQSDELTPQTTPSVSYMAHVEEVGWQDWVSDGTIAGTTGEGLRMEAIRLKLSGVSGSITYQTHVQEIGWQDAVSSDAVAGTTGESKRIEAIRISLDGEVASSYDIYYRVHVQNYGWMDWTSDGQTAGTTGLGKRVEAIQVVLVPEGSGAPTGYADPDTDRACVSAPELSYEAHVEEIGWQDWVGIGEIAGTTGQSKRVEALRLQLSGDENAFSGSIVYNAHVEGIGWQNDVDDESTWASDGDQTGTTGQSLRMEAVQIDLTGDVADYCDIYYRVHVQNYGWLDWACNGEEAGSTDRSLRIEAIQVLLVPKGDGAPGSTANPMVSSSYIYIDAGHGWNNTGSGWDSGACGNGYQEADLNSELAELTAYYARNLYGLDVYCNAGGGLNLHARQLDAAARGCTSYVAIHFNSGGGTGTEAYYNSGIAGSSTVGTIVYNHLVEGTGLRNRGLKDYDWTVISGPVPGTLLEVAFVDNSYDMSVYQSRKDYVARQLAAGLCELSLSGY